MFEKIKTIFRKKTFPCIVWDGKTIKYLDLTKKEISDIENNPKCKNWTITINET